MTRSIDVAMLLAVLSLAPLPASANPATYYFSPTGNDQSSGGPAEPWRTLDKANDVLQPGDTAILLPGEYAGPIRPARSGLPGLPITYRSATRWQARVLSGETGWGIDLAARAHIAVDGVVFDGQGRGGWVRARDCSHVTVQRTRMQNSGVPISQFVRCSQVKLLDNLFSKDRVEGNMWRLTNATEVLIEGNSFTRSGHGTLHIMACVNVVIRANVFRNGWGRNYEIFSTGRILIENNIVTAARDSAYSNSAHGRDLYDDGIYRFNRVFGNLGAPLSSGSYLPTSGVAGPTGVFREPSRLHNSRIYHNTFADNLGAAWEIGGMNVGANIFQNNIFYRNDWAGGDVQFIRRVNMSRDNRVIANIFRGRMPDATVVRFENDYLTLAEVERRTPTYSGFWSEFEGNLDADPGFLDLAARDLRVSAKSPAVDSGRPLTLAMGNGSGRRLTVADGRPFFDGFEIEGETGDLIAVGGTDQLARITRVELRYHLPAVLHLDRNVTWQKGAPVSLPWSGKGPDLGAFEHTGAQPTRLMARAEPARPKPGEPISFEVDFLGKAVKSVTWDFEDGTSSTLLSPQHAYAKTGDHGVTVRATLEDGVHLIDVVMVSVGEVGGSSTALATADFEDATRDTEWGYAFKFYPPLYTGAANVPCPDRNGKCMRLFYAPGKQNRQTAVIAPGVWRIDDYPIVRFAYRIPPGVPVAIVTTPFAAPDRPDGFVLGATADGLAGSYAEVGRQRLIADGQWHKISIDLSSLRAAFPEIEFLRRFQFVTPWQENRGQQFWFDDFAILPKN